MKYQIITDSCCDFPKDMYPQLGLKVLPLILHYRDQDTEDCNDDSIRELYAGLRSGEVATTSAINPETWAGAMESALANGEDVLALVFSSGLSTTYQSAVIAAKELAETYPDRKIRVVDTLAASLGQGLLVYYACQKRDEGMELDDLADWCEDTKLHLCHWFTVDDLMYLKRGGRVSAATALLGTMLNIKPVLHMDDHGHLISMSKVRGRKASIEALAKMMNELGAGYDNSFVAISHGDCLEDAQTLAAILKEKCGVKEVLISYVGSVIGSHSGPGTLALFFLGSKR